MREYFSTGVGVAFMVISAWLSLHWDLQAHSELSEFIFWQMRVPRVFMGLLIGGTLSVVGAAFQILFQNPLATPSTVGTTAGATLGALASLALGWSGVQLSSALILPSVALFSFLGALLASGLVVAVALRPGARMEEVLLAGIAITLASGALAQGIHAIADARTLFLSSQWALGQLPQLGYQKVLLAVLPLGLCCALLIGKKRSISSFAMGEDWAQSIGVSTRKTRVLILIAACLGVGTSGALAGPIAFVGLLVPHLIRMTFHPSPARLLPLSCLYGASFLCLTDLLAREVIDGREIPVGVFTALIGAPLLFFAVARRQHF
ncbi:MAG: iron ABC transporter permease [Polyangiaceae bacterium]|nr:iron ABC transporter permease [Polyangiaceae bacterium]